ncbi:MAG: class II fructose-bisphosphate aldolase [Firmicutes bacterium]|jgi:fructose-bisphosphate aldolase class II|nr:class II fructose-bisphosphate aldolase [Bacillota bacterium]
MPLARVVDMLKTATERKYAICAFNVECFDVARAAIEAAEAERAPVIVEAVEPALRSMGLTHIANYVRRLAEEASVPIGLHLDHGGSLDIVRECLEAGFTSVMIDASHLSLEENIRVSSIAVRMGRDYGACVEGEIGRVPGLEAEGPSEGGDRSYTDPAEAAEYCERSGIDCLAVSIGTVHYMRRVPLELDIDLLHRIRKAVRVPLVLHGGAAVVDDDMRTVVQAGICKYNIAFKPYKAFVTGLRNALDNLQEEVSPGKLWVSPAAIMQAGREAAKAEMRSKIRLLGGSGQAGA